MLFSNSLSSLSSLDNDFLDWWLWLFSVASSAGPGSGARGESPSTVSGSLYEEFSPCKKTFYGFYHSSSIVCPHWINWMSPLTYEKPSKLWHDRVNPKCRKSFWDLNPKLCFQASQEWRFFLAWSDNPSELFFHDSQEIILPNCSHFISA